MDSVPVTYANIDPWLTALQVALARGFPLVPLQVTTPRQDRDVVGYWCLDDHQINYLTIPLARLGAHLLAFGISTELPVGLAINRYLGRLPGILQRNPRTITPTSRWDLAEVL